MMVKKICIVVVLLLSSTAKGQVKDWENPAVVGMNKLPYHVTLQQPSKWKDCGEILSLDGDWLFRWSKDPESRPAEFYREDYDVILDSTSIIMPGDGQHENRLRPLHARHRHSPVRLPKGWRLSCE